MVDLRTLLEMGYSNADIVQKGIALGHPLSASTLSRLRTKTPDNTDVAGVSVVLIEILFGNSFAGGAARNELLMRGALRDIQMLTKKRDELAIEAGKASGDDKAKCNERVDRLDEVLIAAELRLEDAIEGAEQFVRDTRVSMKRFMPPQTKDEADADKIDAAALLLCEGQICLYRKKFPEAYQFLMNAWSVIEELAREEPGYGPATYILSRAAGNAFFASCPGVETIAKLEDFPKLRDVVNKMATAPFFKVAKRAVMTTKDERLGGNLSQAFALAGRHDWAAEIVLLLKLPVGTDIRLWTPPGWDKPVMAESYMDGTQTALQNNKKG
jgi:hypothetical protein